MQISATLAANERIRRRIDSGADVLHLAFGEAGLPVHPSVAEALERGSSDNRYGPVAGSPAARAAAAGYFSRRGLPTGPEQIILAPGSKALLFALLSALPGDVVLPQPSWVSYAAQAALAGKRLWLAPIGPQAGGVPDPAALEEVLETARRAGGRPGMLVLTMPDNPTGTLASRALLERVCEIADTHELAIVSDEIYRDLAYDPGAFCSPAELLPGRTYVTSGLSKSMALGGWRIGFARFPEHSAVADAVKGLASEVWSSLAAPMQHVAALVLDEPAEILDHVAASRRLHRETTSAAHRVLAAAGVECRPPAGGFYLYPDLESMRPRLAALGVGSGAALADLLLDRFDIGVLAGAAFGDPPEALRFRLATSLLYGTSDAQRWESLRSSDPTSLPWVGSGLERLSNALLRIASPDHHALRAEGVGA
jgi:aspartate aminotransferase